MKSRGANMEVIEKKIEKEFHICDNCGYDKGFHVSFVKQGDNFEIVLICPECGQRYKIKWKIKLEQ
ncbi:MAG: hypothetical protein Q6356_003410 [Candidatus Wukongarchaeota archaeon]|nr:hypothetical protein [Candidatus Wukongarchaeota archaeon]